MPATARADQPACHIPRAPFAGPASAGGAGDALRFAITTPCAMHAGRRASVPAYNVTKLLETATLSVFDAVCDGTCQHDDAALADVTHLIFPYRGVHVRHLGRDEAVAEPNQALFHNAGDAARTSHPVPGGDASLLLAINEQLLSEVAPKSLLREETRPMFLRQRMRIDPRAQALVAMLRHSLREGVAQPLEGEDVALTLLHRAIGSKSSQVAGAGHSQQRLTDRVKLVLTSDLARRWTLAEIAAEVGGSPVYLTQVFRQVEGVPLSRYQLRLRLAKSLDLLAQYEDLSALSHELGFSSHSHFSAAFRQAYGRSPTEFRDAVLSR
jgi:AraC-like DNA-binding protein